MKFRSILSALLLITSVAAAPTAKAALIFSIQQDGSDVLFSGSGTADTTGFVLGSTGAAVTGVAPSAGAIVSSGLYSVLSGLSGPTSFGPGGFAAATSFSGSQMGLNGGFLLLPVGYVSGTFLSSTMTFASNTLAGMGLTIGTYTRTWGSGDHADSLTLYIGVPVPSAVPVPASLLLLATGVAALGAARRRMTA